ncbi:hypothetical protein Hanom_Chr02g00095171 [Helianthus anomalus]
MGQQNPLVGLHPDPKQHDVEHQNVPEAQMKSLGPKTPLLKDVKNKQLLILTWMHPDLDS